MKYLEDGTSSILLAIDFSQTSQRAFDAALRMARCFAARVHILHVNEEDALFGGHSSDELNGFVKNIVARRADWMNRFEERAREMEVNAVAIMEEGDPATVILQQADKVEAGIIVIGTQGAHGLGNMLPGSVARKVLRRAERPVLVVSRSAGVAPADGGGSFEHIVYPTDFSEASRRGLDLCEQIAEVTNAKTTVINVLRMPRIFPSLPGEPMLALPFRAVDHLEDRLKAQMAELVAHLGQRVESEIGVHTDPAEGICEMAAHGGVDLIVMPRHSSHGVSSFVFGSTAERLVTIAPVPVLLFTPKA